MSIALKRFIILAFVHVSMCAMCCYAQDVAEDYRQYKFYPETEETNTWWVEAAERDEHYDRVALINYAPNADYALSAAGFLRRGLGYNERRYMAGMLEVDYSTMRQLGRLGLRHDGNNNYFQNIDAQYYAGHYLRAEFSGKDYIGGLSHRARYKPAKDGVELKDGWSFAHYARARTGRDLYVDGVYTNALDIAAMTTYKGRRDWLNVVVMLPLSERGLRQTSVEEAYTLTDNKMYNPAWGFQNGEMRSSRVVSSLRPEIVAHWQRRLSVNTNLNLSANVYFERRGYSTLAWFNARNPQPDNYRYMPSYYADDNTSREVREAWQNNDVRYTQIDWDDLYHTNILQANGGARYAVECRRENNLHMTTAAIFKSRVGSFDFTYGVELGYHSSREFKVMDDLLGADHLVDIDYYLIDDATSSNSLQNNLRDPNRIIVEGDRFGYDFRLTRWGGALSGSMLREWTNMSLAVSLRTGFETTRRRGYYEKELFAGSGSYGLSKNLATSPYDINALWNYHLDNHSVRLSVLLRGESPEVEDMFLQSEYNNRAIADYGLATILAADATYGYVAQNLSLAATLFVLATANECDVIHYYDDLEAVYSDAVISGISRLHLGVEASAKVIWSQHFSSTFSLMAARYRYLRDAKVDIYADTNNDLVAATSAAMRGYHTGSPELAAYGDVMFRHSGWLARMSVAYCGLRYIAPSYIRRTERVLSFAQSPEDESDLMREQRLADAVTLDVSLSKRIRLKDGLSLGLQLSARNLLGSSFVRSGYEQNRIQRRVIMNRTFVSPFANRLTYAYPRTFYLAASLYF